MAINFEYFNNSDNAVYNGVFVPISSLWNIQASELASTRADRESRVIFALLEILCNPSSPFNSISNKLGLSTVYSNPVGVAPNIINQTYTLTSLYWADLSDNRIKALPIPTVGSFANQGGVRITDVFPGAVKKNAGDSVTEGINIRTDQLVNYGAPAHADIDVNADSRMWFSALFLYLADTSTVRNSVTPSAVVASNSLVTSNGVLPSGQLIANTNPISGLNPTKQSTNLVITRTVSITLQKLINTQTETVQPNHVVA